MPGKGYTTVQFVIYVILIGAGATLFMDGWALLMKQIFGLPLTRYEMVGRWLGYMPDGTFTHNAITESPPIVGETVIGWAVHYVTGICYAFILLAVCGPKWFQQPTVFPALCVGIITIIIPFFIMQPAFGLGIAASNVPAPNLARLKSLMAHTSFGVGLYVAAWLSSKL